MKRFLCAAALILVMLLMAGCSGKGEISVGTGSVGGSYYAYGTALTNAITDDFPELSFKVRETAGSVANIRLMDGGYVKLALTQSDILRDAEYGTGMFDRKIGGYSAIAGLYTEACQIVVPANSDIKSVGDLYGKRVSLGEKESGVLLNARQILSGYGLSEDMIDAKYLSFTNSAAEMEKGNIDAFFCTAGVPTTAVSELAKLKDIRLLPIDETVAGRLIDSNRGYTKYTIEAGSYKGQTEDVEVLGIKTVLITSDELSEDAVYKITKGLFDNSTKLQFAAGGSTALDTRSAIEDIPIAFHSGAAKYYKEQGINVSKEDNSNE